jgi:hypothetical protein
MYEYFISGKKIHTSQFRILALKMIISNPHDAFVFVFVLLASCWQQLLATRMLPVLLVAQLLFILISFASFDAV